MICVLPLGVINDDSAVTFFRWRGQIYVKFPPDSVYEKLLKCLFLTELFQK